MNPEPLKGKVYEHHCKIWKHVEFLTPKEVRSAVEYRKEWQLYIMPKYSMMGCHICRCIKSKVYSHPTIKKPLWICEDCIDKHCYPDLYPVEKELKVMRNETKI